MKVRIIFIIFVFLITSFGRIIILADEIDIKSKIKDLKSPDTSVRLLSIRDLAKLRNEESMNILANHLKVEKDAYLRVQIVEALTMYNSTTTRQAIIEALDDPNPSVRFSAVINSGYLGLNEQLLDAFSTRVVKEKNKDVKLAMANTLGLSKSKSAVGILSHLLKDEDKDIKKGTIASLDKIGTKDAIELLEKSKFSDPEISKKVEKVLERHKQKTKEKKK